MDTTERGGNSEPASSSFQLPRLDGRIAQARWFSPRAAFLAGGGLDPSPVGTLPSSFLSFDCTASLRFSLGLIGPNYLSTFSISSRWATSSVGGGGGFCHVLPVCGISPILGRTRKPGPFLVPRFRRLLNISRLASVSFPDVL